jgi:hypothetical protein
MILSKNKFAKIIPAKRTETKVNNSTNFNVFRVGNRNRGQRQNIYLKLEDSRTKKRAHVQPSTSMFNLSDEDLKI